jgi:hypothetical protein
MFRFRPFTLLLMIAICLAAASSAAADYYEIRQPVQFHQSEFKFDKIDQYDNVWIIDGSALNHPGKPMLPAREIQIALPAGMKVENVSVTDIRSSRLPGDYNIYPAQEPRRTGFSISNAPFIEPDSKIYTSNNPFPANVIEFTGQADLAGQAIARILVYPLQYNPVEGQLTLHNSLTLVLECSPGYECGDYLSRDASQETSTALHKMISEMVINPADVQLNAAVNPIKSRQLPAGPFDHVIITDGFFETGMKPLADWHTQRGLRDTVITTGWIEANFSGADKKEKIRNFVSDAFSTWGCTYFLMIGESGYVPFEFRTYYTENTPSDQYYTDFDDDWVHEVAVGRATCGSVSACGLFIDKVLKYEKDPPRTGYILEATLLGMDLDASTHCQLLKENIIGYVPARFNFNRIYDTDASNHRTDFLNALNAGAHLVNHADHSYISTMGTGDFNHGWGINSSDVNNLTNVDEMSIIVSNGCDPNRMDYGDCISEYFVVANPNRAAVAFTGNTRSGLYYSGQPLSLSNELDRRWWLALFVSDEYHLGQMLILAKNQFTTGSDGGKQHCEWTFNLLGEPAMPIWTDDPDSFHVVCPPTMKTTGDAYTVHVEDSSTSADIENAYVCLWKANEEYLTGYTDVNGDVTFYPEPDTDGLIYVTVTRHNYIPHEDEITVIGFICGDASGDEIVNVSDAVYIINYIFAGGDPPDPLESADVNCDGEVNVSDAVYIINFIFSGGFDPCDPDGNGQPDC